jgi:hypothetical protein
MKTNQSLALVLIFYMFFTNCNSTCKKDSNSWALNNNSSVRIINDSIACLYLFNQNGDTLRKSFITTVDNNIAQIEYFLINKKCFSYNPSKKTFKFFVFDDKQKQDIQLPIVKFKEVNENEVEINITCLNYPVMVSSIKVEEPNIFKGNSFVRDNTLNFQRMVVKLNSYPIEFMYKLQKEDLEVVSTYSIIYDGSNVPIVKRIDGDGQLSLE